MGRKCFKCKYERVASDSVPDYECPKCGAIYAKVEAAMKKKTSNLHLSDGEKRKVREASMALEKKKDKIKKEKPEKENNKLTKCEICGKEVSKTAKTCPYCGEENPVSINLVSNKSPGIFSIVVVIFFVLWIVGKFSGTDDDSSASKSNSRVSNTEIATLFTAVPPSAESLTGSQKNAVRSAKQYLSMQGFSQEGLIQQLSSDYGDGYKADDAIIAVGSLNVDWNKEAVKSAKLYLSMQGFSCKGLIEQLSSSAGDKYTVTQATFGARKAGACQ